MTTKIEWVKDQNGVQGETWNPITGCTKVSAGCKNCYAEIMMHRFGKGRKFTDIQLHEDRLSQPLRWKKPRTIFVNSMSDLFHEAVPDAFIEKVFGVMALCTQHTFQVLTKRPERMKEFMITTQHESCVAELCTTKVEFFSPVRKMSRIDNLGAGWAWPLPNVWLGVSAENQDTYEDRANYLKDLQISRWNTFLSLEPLLGPIDLKYWDPENPQTQGEYMASLEGVGVIGKYRPHKWVIVGGESGPHARPMHPDWARSLRDQCVEAGVPFFFKQWGEFKSISEMEEAEYRQYYHPNKIAEEGERQEVLNDVWGEHCTVESYGFQYDGGRGYELIEGHCGYQVFRVGKKRAGRLLDGRVWDQMPERAQAGGQ